MLLSNLSNIINIKKTHNFNKDKYFSTVTSNSKLVNRNTIFVIDKNSKIKIEYIKEALKKNTPAIISNKYYRFLPIPQFIVSNISFEMELLLKKIYKKLPYRTIAITGTNGKTSVVWYISKILSLLNYNSTFVGTLGFYKNGKKIEETNLTTPAYEELFKYGSLNSKQKNIFIFEASSHALDQNRIRNYPINIAAITNISNDHLDYHKNISEYRKAKLKLFKKHISKKGYAVLNSKIKNISNSLKKLDNYNIKKIYFGTKNIFFENKKNVLTLKFLNKNFVIKNLKFKTDLELENLACAITCCHALNIKINKILGTLPYITNPPGRLQEIKYKEKKSQIIIDYAHTPDALKKILISLKINKRKPVLVFGCGGDRDKNKRKSMGLIANKYASRVYITDDNPRKENASSIRKNIIKYCPSAIEIPNRRQAISKSIKDLKLNEILIIAGKGHEKKQIINNKSFDFDDYKIAKEIIKK